MNILISVIMTRLGSFIFRMQAVFAKLNFVVHGFLLPQLWLIHTARELDQGRYREQDWEQWSLINCTEVLTLVQDRERNQDPLFPIVLV